MHLSAPLHLVQPGLENCSAGTGKLFGLDWKIVRLRLENRLAQIEKSFRAD